MMSYFHLSLHTPHSQTCMRKCIQSRPTLADIPCHPSPAWLTRELLCVLLYGQLGCFVVVVFVGSAGKWEPFHLVAEQSIDGLLSETCH